MIRGHSLDVDKLATVACRPLAILVTAITAIIIAVLVIIFIDTFPVAALVIARFGRASHITCAREPNHTHAQQAK